MTKSRLLALGAVALVVAGGAALVAAPPATAATLSSRIDATLARHGLSGAGGVKVVVAGSGRLLYTRNAGRRLTPASNVKLVTAATALARWGPDHRFRTELYVPPDPPDADGVLHGDVYIKGFGDPTLCTTAYARNVLRRPAAHLNDLVPALQAMGVKRIEGHVAGDESYFDSRRQVSTWSAGDWAYCGPLSALSLNRGIVDGRRVSNPAKATAKKFTEQLRAAGIRVTGAPRVGRVPAGWLLARTERSPPLWRVLRGMNKPSDNFYAEQLTKGLGAAFRGTGTTTAGARVAGNYLRRCGIASTQFRLYDGSGLSRGNKLTAAAVSRLLRVVSKTAGYRVYRDSLSVAGRDGTLTRRMRGTAAAGNVHAKTGTLTGASCLSGYVTAANGRRLAFAILVNRSYLNIAAAQAAQDAIAVTLARSRP